MRSTELRSATARVGAIRALGLLGFLVLAARASHLTVIDDQGDILWSRQVHARIELPAARGVIFDRRGVELAVTTTSPSIYAVGRYLEPATLPTLARALGMPGSALDERLGDRPGFTYLARWVEPERAERIADLHLPGIGIVHESRRSYPAGTLGGRLLGFADIDGNGVRGIEQQEDRWLSGTRIVVPVERDGSGQLLARAALRPSDAAGGDIALTLDSSLQAEAEGTLREAVAASGARGGSIVTLDPGTGDVLALAEWPPFDPNDFRTTPYNTTGASTFLSATEPGSTLKVFLVAAALEAEALSTTDTIDTLGGQLAVPGKTIHDRRDFGTLDLAGVLRVSSNVGAVLAAQRVGRKEHHAALRRFGFGQPTGSGFPSESAGLLRPWRSWQPLDHATIAFGQGISATPIQLAAATAAIANGGTWRTPRLVLARRPPDGAWQYTRPAASHPAVSRETADAVLAMMRDVVGAEGTGRLAALHGLSVAGKTGTAQKLDPITSSYAKDRFVAWFIGAVPAETPKLVVTVALDEPRGVHSGGGIAAPIFARVAAAQLAHLGIITRPEPIPASLRPISEPSLVAQARVSTTGDRLDSVRSETAAAVIADGAPAQIAGHPGAGGGVPAAARSGTAPRERIAAASAHDSRPAPAAAVRVQPVSSPPPEPLVIVAVEDRVFVPDFRGYTLEEVRRITAAHALDLEASGRGRAVSQQPAPGTILAGRQRSVRVRFAAGDPAQGEG